MTATPLLELGPVEPPVQAAGGWDTNAELIRDVARLYRHRRADVVVDATYGEGAFWTLHRPAGLIAHDKFKLDGVDFRQLPEADGTVDIHVLDPAYVATGGRATSTLTAPGGMVDAYGMHTTEATPDAQWKVILDGVTEARRVVRNPQRRPRQPGGLLWLKVMDYVTGGRNHWYTFDAKPELESRGFRLIDRFVMPNGGGPQPARNRDGSLRLQQHPRNNVSTLLVAEAVT